MVFDYADGVERTGLDQLTEVLQAYLGNCGPTQHATSVLLVDVRDENSASCRAYVHASHQGANDAADLFCDISGEYVDDWGRTPQGWRITRRVAVPALVHGDLAALGTSKTLSA